ncbi:hypothetical protein LOC51_31465 [Rubrivivax sp. JA1024]|nr:hypothetical protein [Rubrivivax sp. JA1024]
MTKALKAAAAAGMSVARFEIDPDGKLVVVAGPPISEGDEATEPAEWRSVR